MSRVGKAIDGARRENRAALVVYLCAGDPSLESTPLLVQAIAEGGADVVELGMPFSDPTADGLVIQRSSQRALKAGATLNGVLDCVRTVRAAGCEVPLLLFGYYNPILAMGERTFCERAASTGVDGLLVVDLPLEESESLRNHAAHAGLKWVPLIAPTTDDERAVAIAKTATGFVYSVSRTGVTGATTDLAAAASRARALEAACGRPVAVGFGIRDASDARQIARLASGVVVGSAVVRTIEEHAAEATNPLREQVSALAAACRR